MYFLEARSSQLTAGFTLVEMIIAVSLFTVVALISTAALLSLADANRKAQALQLVMNNLNIALDGMVRSIRMGSTYHCVPDGSPDDVFTSPRPCPDGGMTFALERYGGNPSDARDQWLYWFQNGRIYKSETGSKAGGFALTTPEVSIDAMSFYVVGTTRGDVEQPKVLITIKGTASAQNVRTKTSFSIQATAVQRLLDL